jgi:hypothetical protein
MNPCESLSGACCFAPPRAAALCATRPANHRQFCLWLDPAAGVQHGGAPLCINSRQPTTPCFPTQTKAAPPQKNTHTHTHTDLPLEVRTCFVFLPQNGSRFGSSSKCVLVLFCPKMGRGSVPSSKVRFWVLFCPKAGRGSVPGSKCVLGGLHLRQGCCCVRVCGMWQRNLVRLAYAHMRIVDTSGCGAPDAEPEPGMRYRAPRRPWSGRLEATNCLAALSLPTPSACSWMGSRIAEALHCALPRPLGRRGFGIEIHIAYRRAPLFVLLSLKPPLIACKPQAITHENGF